MAVGYTPAVEIYGASAALINSRLIDWEITDAAGIESDQLKLTVNTEGLEGLPNAGGKIGIRIGYKETGLVDKGEFIISRRTPNLFPSRLLIVATAAPFTHTDDAGFRARRSASHGPTTLGALFRELTSKYGFSPRVAPELALLKIEHVDQSNETDMAFLTRLAGQYDAVTKPVNDVYVLARRGQVKSLSGKILPDVPISVTEDNHPGSRSFIAASIDDDARIKFRGCKTTWWDGESGKECIVEVGAEPFKKVRQRYQGEAEAKAAAEGESRKMEREAVKLRVDCPGNPDLAAEGLALLDATWPSFMQGRWSIDKVTHSGSRQQSFRSSFEASYPGGKKD
ncbi:contractile injection system protein, VgrG/Pvc8 family [Pseudomonas luteola]|uniref:contractile injection system protein, VgrG/Pvc8 family n=1 Tax=Pseudomonas luteola TaxID=47886 RepID=UPI0015E31607|nr:contractile injection system protein, VgrG/Pvc8 family [Pseudomonas zeshuii]MBA1250905.1 phage late control D family protein [Pseudomonas zeshuii]